MKKLTLLLLFTYLNVFAQTSEITSEGKAKIKVKPDVALLTITVSKENVSEKNALKELNEEMEKLQKFFSKLGFANSSIKISEYNITEDHYGGEKKQYNAKNTLVIDFKLDTKVLDAFYQELQAGNYKDVLVDFEAELSQELEKSSRKNLVQLAITDAQANADNIAKALKVTVVKIKSVSKFGNDMHYRIVEEVKYKPMAAAMVSAPPTSFSKYEVEEIELEENITIVFEIVNPVGKF